MEKIMGSIKVMEKKEKKNKVVGYMKEVEEKIPGRKGNTNMRMSGKVTVGEERTVTRGKMVNKR